MVEVVSGIFYSIYFLLSEMKKTIQQQYVFKIQRRMQVIDRKYDKKLALRETAKEREKQVRTKRLMDKMNKELIAEKRGREAKPTIYEKKKAETTSFADACWLAQF